MRGLFSSTAIAVGILMAGYASGATAAGIVIGPGHNPVQLNDVNPSLTIVDLTHEVTLAAGTYKVATFDTQFTNVGGAPHGTITPILVSDNGGGSYTSLAVGTVLDGSWTTPAFASTPFGGSDTFTLTTTTLVAAGVNHVTPDMAVGYEDNIGLVAAF